MMCNCCGRRDGITSGGCLHCGSRTTCAACGRVLSCNCGREVEMHACPNVQVVSAVLVTPTIIVEPLMVVTPMRRVP
jgi:hypothetical protein